MFSSEIHVWALSKALDGVLLSSRSLERRMYSTWLTPVPLTCMPTPQSFNALSASLLNLMEIHYCWRLYQCSLFGILLQAVSANLPSLNLPRWEARVTFQLSQGLQLTLKQWRLKEAKSHTAENLHRTFDPPKLKYT